jgi:hypothetical protein
MLKVTARELVSAKGKKLSQAAKPNCNALTFEI